MVLLLVATLQAPSVWLGLKLSSFLECPEQLIWRLLVWHGAKGWHPWSNIYTGQLRNEGEHSHRNFSLCCGVLCIILGRLRGIS